MCLLTRSIDKSWVGSRIRSYNSVGKEGYMNKFVELETHLQKIRISYSIQKLIEEKLPCQISVIDFPILCSWFVQILNVVFSPSGEKFLFSVQGKNFAVYVNL